MTTDRELLELAAKAAGYRMDFDGHRACGIWRETPDHEALYWNPLTDDGDAFRLAVKLAQIGAVGFRLDRQGATAFVHDEGLWVPHSFFYGTDGDAAARRAVVSAAAELGKAKP